MTKITHTVQELAEITGVPVRTIRYYQTMGLLPAPEIRNRKALYSHEHVEQVQRIRREKASISLTKMSADLQTASSKRLKTTPRQPVGLVEDIKRFTVCDGIELLISTDRAGLTGEALQRFFSEVTMMANTFDAEAQGQEFSLRPATPDGTLAVLDELVELGLTNDVFQIIHPKLGETILRHRQYVEDRGSFRSNSRNVQINHRLQFCLWAVRHAKRPFDWSDIARRAANSVPLCEV